MLKRIEKNLLLLGWRSAWPEAADVRTVTEGARELRGAFPDGFGVVSVLPRTAPPKIQLLATNALALALGRGAESKCLCCCHLFLPDSVESALARRVLSSTVLRRDQRHVVTTNEVTTSLALHDRMRKGHVDWSEEALHEVVRSFVRQLSFGAASAA
jgi:hypothetical protein